MKLVRSIFLALAVLFSASTVLAADAPAGDAAGAEKKEKKAKKGKKAEGAEGEKKAEEKPAK
jgi:hypothetical protein